MQKITHRKRHEGRVLHERERRGTESAERFIGAFAAIIAGGDPDHTDCWVSGGDEYVVETWCQPGESAAACQERHDEAVTEGKAEFPPDPGETCDE